MKSYKKPIYRKTKIKVNESTEGERLETKIERAVSNKEKLEGEAPLIFTERKEGVLAGTNVRTDRFEVAIEAKDKINRSLQARRDEKAKMEIVKDEETTEAKTDQKEVKIEAKTKEGEA